MIKITLEQAAAIKRIESDINVLQYICSRSGFYKESDNMIDGIVGIIDLIKSDHNIEIVF
jgi:hypothetical protein